MQIVKKDGQFENFDIAKMKSSIAKASDDAGEPLNLSDIDVLANGALKHLNNFSKNGITSENIFESVLMELEKDRFYNIAKFYREKTNL